MNSLKDSIENFVEHFLPENWDIQIRDKKVIHDSLWGTCEFDRWEIAVINTPLIQRLRQIRQIGFAYLTFPSATHSRFEHTLGVAHQTKKLIHALKPKYEKLFEGKTEIELQLAALLHDCGHGPFSHSSEEIYLYSPEIQELITTTFKSISPHELIAYFIVKSERFQNFALQLKKIYNIEFDLEEVANLIIGGRNEDERRYTIEVINGPFDADKIDYIIRDGHFSGLPLPLDLDRLWYALETGFVKDDESNKEFHRLVLRFNGVVPLEQIIFNRMVLFSTIYHHHKVRACDCLLKGIIEYCNRVGLTIGGRFLKSAVDFLWLTDDKILGEGEQAKEKEKDDKRYEGLHKMIHRLLYRKLLKRALVISMATIEKGGEDGYQRFQKLSKNKPQHYSELRILAKEIWEEAGEPCLEEEIWVDLPRAEPTIMGEKTYIYQSEGVYVPIKEFFPADKWAEQYGIHKWKGHVFCPPELCDKIAKVSKEVIEDKYKFRFKSAAWELCHTKPYNN